MNQPRLQFRPHALGMHETEVELVVHQRIDLLLRVELAQRDVDARVTGLVALEPLRQPAEQHEPTKPTRRQNTTARATIVAFGDSITDGFNSTLDGSKRYPNDLSSPVLSNAGSAGYSVVNAGISGNRILHDVFGPMATGRFERDALASTGASHVLILIGINDIGFSNIIPSEAVTPDQITAGLQQLVDKAKAKSDQGYQAMANAIDLSLFQ